MTWQPIETAPKDETVLLWNGEDVSEGEHVNGRWWSAADLADCEYGLPMTPEPTHWMPLPQPPEDK